MVPASLRVARSLGSAGTGQHVTRLDPAAPAQGLLPAGAISTVAEPPGREEGTAGCPALGVYVFTMPADNLLGHLVKCVSTGPTLPSRYFLNTFVYLTAFSQHP